MRLNVNGKDTEIEDVTTLKDLVTQYRIAEAERGVAVALNNEVIPKSAWAATRLNPGDVVEIIRAVQGG